MPYGRIPDDRPDLWRKHRNYLINCIRRVNAEFIRIIEALDRLDLWEDTVVILASDHGEMNGAHRIAQKGAIHYNEATVVNLTVCAGRSAGTPHPARRIVSRSCADAA